jgi:hypothetical protein
MIEEALNAGARTGIMPQKWKKDKITVAGFKDSIDGSESKIK